MSRDGAPGAFTAVAVSGGYIHNDELIPPESLLPLPRGVLVHAGHRPDTFPVGIAVPRYRNGRIIVDAVLSSRAQRAWDRVCDAECGVSLVASEDHWVRDESTFVFTSGVLRAADLVRHALDPDARYLSVRRRISREQRAVQEAFDAWLDRQHFPPAPLMDIDVRLRGVAGMDANLAHIVAPLWDELESTSEIPRSDARVSADRLEAIGGR